MPNSKLGMSQCALGEQVKANLAIRMRITLQSFIGGGFSEIVDFGGGEESESANSEAVVGNFADACPLEGLDRQSDAS